MISRRTAAILLGSASLGLVAAATGPASAHPGHNASAKNGEAKSASEQARPNRARRGARGARQCNIAPAQLLTTANNDRLEKVGERLDARVADGDITQARADKRFERIQKKVTIKVAMRTAKQAPVLALFGAKDAKALRTAISEAGGVRALIEATEGVEVADFRAARRSGRTAAREARADLCTSGNSSETEEAPNSL